MKVLLIRAAVIDVTGWQFGHVNGTKLRASHDQVPLVMVRASARDGLRPTRWPATGVGAMGLFGWRRKLKAQAN